jgi:hypothetical protein
MRKQKNDPFPRSEFRDRLDAILAAGERAGIALTEIAGMLEGRAAGLRQHHTMSAPVESAGILPKTTVYDGRGNLVERVTAALKGEY